MVQQISTMEGKKRFLKGIQPFPRFSTRSRNRDGQVSQYMYAEADAPKVPSCREHPHDHDGSVLLWSAKTAKMTDLEIFSCEERHMARMPCPYCPDGSSTRILDKWWRRHIV